MEMITTEVAEGDNPKSASLAVYLDVRIALGCYEASKTIERQLCALFRPFE